MNFFELHMRERHLVHLNFAFEVVQPSYQLWVERNHCASRHTQYDRGHPRPEKFAVWRWEEYQQRSRLKRRFSKGHSYFYMGHYITTWNLKHLFINGCFNWMIPNHCIKNCCFTKHPFKSGCSGYQATQTSCTILREMGPSKSTSSICIKFDPPRRKALTTMSPQNHEK